MGGACGALGTGKPSHLHWLQLYLVTLGGSKPLSFEAAIPLYSRDHLSVGQTLIPAPCPAPAARASGSQAHPGQ